MASIEVEYGYGNSAKGGRNLPLRVVVVNDGEEALSGALEVLTRQSDNAVYAYDYPLNIPSGDTVTSEMTVPVSALSDQLAVRVVGEDGSLTAVKRVKLNISTAPPEIFIGLLSDHPEKLQYLNEASVNYGQLRTRAFALKADTFPVDRARLDMLDVIVASSFRMSSLSVEQTRALMQWMREGGVLLIGTGERVDDTLGVFAPEFLDDMYEEPVMTELRLSALQSLDTPGSSEIAIPLVSLSLHGGSTSLSADTVPLIQAVNKGTGILAAASFDFTDFAEYAAGHRIPLVIFSASGGARMQEGLFSLLQMAKTSAAVGRFRDAGGLFVSVLLHPATGGVSASYASLGDIILAEPDALIGFAGPRVIRQTIGETLPEGFQHAEFQLEHGMVDRIVERSELKTTLAAILRLHRPCPAKTGDGRRRGLRGDARRH